MTIAKRITENIKKNNGKYLTCSTVWDMHNSSIGQNKNSNVFQAVKRLFEKNDKIVEIWAKVGATGWSQHSKSDVLLFDVSGMSSEDFENAGIVYVGTYFNREDIK